jgi:PleD family two-component response regulator
MCEDCFDLQGLIRRADQALYVTKETGRGRITAWTENMRARR